MHAKTAIKPPIGIDADIDVQVAELRTVLSLMVRDKATKVATDLGATRTIAPVSGSKPVIIDVIP